MMLFRKLMLLTANAASVAVAAVGCTATATRKQVPIKPTAWIQTDYFYGTPLSGPATRPAATSAPSSIFQVHVTFISLENVPSTAFDPVGSRAVFFSSTGGNSTVLSAAELQRNATITDLKFPGDLPALLRKGNSGILRTIGESNGFLTDGTTVSFSVSDPRSFVDPVTGTTFHRSVEVSLGNETPRQLALAINDFSAWRDGGFGRRTEKSIFNLPNEEKQNTALVVPFQFTDSPIKAVAILLQISPATEAPTDRIANAMQQALTHRATTQPIFSTGGPDSSSTIRSAVDLLAPIAGRRSSLVFLANQTGASLCEDVALEANDALLAQLVKSIRDKVQSEPDTGWVLDRCTLELLAKKLAGADNGGGKVPAELEAILLNHTGEVGRHSSSMDELLRGLSSKQDFETRLVVQNTIYLEDSSPAARVRAFDWLNARHLTPSGFDPLASARARREALEKAAAKP